jgi:carbon-monoxide dehydrogenase medium subunit
MHGLMDYRRAENLEDALAYLASSQPARPLAGGTDMLLHGKPGGEDFTALDISALDELDYIRTHDGGLRIGAATRMIDLEHSPLLNDAFICLKQGAREVGSIQIRHLATLGGNLCNASPSADTAAPLLALDASARLASRRGERQATLEDFFLGPGRTILEPDELLLEVQVPAQPPGAQGLYLKLKVRQALDLAIVGVAAVLWPDDGGFQARIGLAAVAPTPLRAREAERYLAQADRLDAGTIEQAARLAAEACSPIDDSRGTARYRKDMVQAFTRKVLRQLAGQLAPAQAA